MKKEAEILVVDLDGTLLRSDMFYETFWSAISKNALVFFRFFMIVFSKSLAFQKSFLYKNSDVDISKLPYDKNVISYIVKRKKNGSKVILATATNYYLAKKISEYLGFFDEVLGSSEERNLKGRIKASLLSKKFGNNNFDYMGDSFSDFPVWERSRGIILVNASYYVEKRARKLKKPLEHIKRDQPRISDYLFYLRVHQWVKNLLVFVPILAAQKLDYESMVVCTLAFFSFSIVASSVYVFNDLLDLSFDRGHPLKSKRPSASGLIKITIFYQLVFL